MVNQVKRLDCISCVLFLIGWPINCFVIKVLVGRKWIGHYRCPA